MKAFGDTVIAGEDQQRVVPELVFEQTFFEESNRNVGLHTISVLKLVVLPRTGMPSRVFIGSSILKKAGKYRACVPLGSSSECRTVYCPDTLRDVDR